MARNLMKNGHKLVVYDINRTVVAAFKVSFFPYNSNTFSDRLPPSDYFHSRLTAPKSLGALLKWQQRPKTSSQCYPAVHTLEKPTEETMDY